MELFNECVCKNLAAELATQGLRIKYRGSEGKVLYLSARLNCSRARISVCTKMWNPWHFNSLLFPHHSYTTQYQLYK